MSRQYLRDQRGLTLGWIDDRETDQIGYNAQGLRRGRYDKQHNRTDDERGLVVGTGNLLAALIFKK
jgi:hypothetical protein